LDTNQRMQEDPSTSTVTFHDQDDSGKPKLIRDCSLCIFILFCFLKFI
jgi:hypothetical protein